MNQTLCLCVNGRRVFKPALAKRRAVVEDISADSLGRRPVLRPCLVDVVPIPHNGRHLDLENVVGRAQGGGGVRRSRGGRAGESSVRGRPAAPLGRDHWSVTGQTFGETKTVIARGVIVGGCGHARGACPRRRAAASVYAP